MSSERNLKMSDLSIAHIAKLIQVALLTGTDLVDHLRTLEFSVDENNNLVPSENSLSALNSEIESMFTDLEKNNETESEAFQLNSDSSIFNYRST